MSSNNNNKGQEKKASSPQAGKRKEKEAAAPAHVMETRTRKKARQTFDFVTGTAQRAESALNLLGEDYTGPSDDELKMIFRVYDRDNDGKIGAEEIADVLRSMGKRPLTRKIQKMLDACDPNKHGYITRDEFVKFLKAKAAKKAEQMGVAPKAEEKEQDKTKEKAKGKKEAAPSAEKKAEKKKADKGEEKEKKVNKKKDLERRPSTIINYYTSNAGTQGNSEAPMDKYNNPLGNEFDLGQDNAFGEFAVLIGFFYNAFDAKPMTEALQTKGFTVKSVNNEKAFVDELQTNKYSQAWIIPTSSYNNTGCPQHEFLDAVLKFHAGGGGLFLWGDNEPYFVQTNIVLERLFGISFTGNDHGCKTLSYGDTKETQKFGAHLLTSGLQHLYEGNSICYPNKIPVIDGAGKTTLEVLATNSHGHPVILFADSGSVGGDGAGRVVLDCGFTKLWVQWDSAGTARYVKNAATWLVGVESRLASETTTTTTTQPKEEKITWQYKHGGWLNYDDDAAKLVEEAYQDWKGNPYTDVRAVKSGSWQYSVDFKQMIQTNIQHEAHTQREVRRVVEEAK